MWGLVFDILNMGYKQAVRGRMSKGDPRIKRKKGKGGKEKKRAKAAERRM